MSNKEKTIYTIATAHLDTSWLWTYERSIDEYIPDTFNKNFELLDKYPEYNFNFEGSLRYELLKEYYPEIYEKLKKYIKAGRWNPCGACYENGDVNIPSPEALFRNILYGNGYFRKEFGVESNDIFIPDCFGFGRALPTVAAHSGLKGFSTCKLPWGASVDIPFDIGYWKGPDGNGVYSAINPFSYTSVMKDVRNNKRITDKLDENIKKYDLPKTFVYHGDGDRGGYPSKKSLKAVVDAARENNNSDIKVLSATTKEFFENIDSLPEEKKDMLPVWNSEFLMTRHGTGSYTSRTVTKRWNRRNELLADAAERFASAAFIHGINDYPSYTLDNAWKRVIAHHFHDDITGTSFEECYMRSHNDLVQSMHAFSAEYTAATKALVNNIDTSFVKGTAVAVSNPLQTALVRKEAVRVTIDSNADYFTVTDKNGRKLPAQTKAVSAGKKEITFIAEVSSCGIAIYDIEPSEKEPVYECQLSVTENVIENKNVRVEINSDGDICSVFDKKLGKELLSAPVKMGIFNNVHSFDWPAWEIKYEDVSEKPYLFPEKPEIRIKDNGSVFSSIEIVRKANNSVFTQIISLDAESEFVSVYNETDWREEASLLKACFTLSAENSDANYDIGIGYTKRGTNTEKLYEVPAQKWADITDKSEQFGVSIFSDSRTGWDKPDNNTLRLTCIHTPFANYRHECSQHIMDMGINRYSFALCGHNGNPDDISALADAFCQPMHTFITDKHEGRFDKEYSFMSLNNDKVRVSAIKKAQNSDEIILRVVECSGKGQKGVEADFALPVSKVFEVNGSEIQLSEVILQNSKLKFDIGANAVKTFALSFDNENSVKKSNQKQLRLNYNSIGITDNKHRRKSTLKGAVSVPSEIVPEKVLSGGILYNLTTEGKNCLVADGSEIFVPSGYDTLHLLITSLENDRDVEFIVSDKAHKLTVQSAEEYIGLWDLMQNKVTAYIKSQPQAVTFTHTHDAYSDITGKQFYLFHAEIPLDGAERVTLPDDENIVIFSAVAAKNEGCLIKGDEHFDTVEEREFDYEFSEYAVKHSERNRIERFLDKFLNRDFCIHFVMDGCYNKNSLGDLYFIINNVIDRLKFKKRKENLLRSRAIKTE